MQSKRDELDSGCGSRLSDLNGPVAAIRDTSPQARHHFTRLPIRCTSLFPPAKRTPIWGSWRE